jgi:hypothetical protein
MSYETEADCIRKWGCEICGGCGEFWYDCDCEQEKGTMRVIVITDTVPDTQNLRIVIVSGLVASPVITLAGVAPWREGNPYCVYGKAVEEFTGCSRFAVDIVVADCRSGGLI